MSRELYIDVKRGLAIFGSAGSGKSRSGFIPVFYTMAKNGLSGIIYDYKDFELTEFINYFFQNSKIPLYTISPGRPDNSHCINPIAPKYIERMDDVNAIAHSFMGNLDSGGGNGESKFFSQAAESCLAGIIWRLKEHFPEQCNIPYAASIIMTKGYEEIGQFLTNGNTYASLLAKPYLDSIPSEKQIAAVQGTLSNAIRKIISPEIFQVFSKSDFNLDLNNPANLGVMNVVNHPKYDTVYAPFLATVIQCGIMNMSERNMNPSLLVLDEASTIKLDRMERIPALLRSYNIGTVFGLQDKIQGVDLYGETKLKAILTNLGAKILGKTNDADTAEYYQKLFELIKEVEKSYSTGTGLSGGGGDRVNISKREKVKHRAYEFNKLKPGEFFVFDEFGENHHVQFDAIPVEPIKSKKIYNYSKTELELNFKNIIDHARILA